MAISLVFGCYMLLEDIWDEASLICFFFVGVWEVSRETELKRERERDILYMIFIEIYYKELTHVVMESEKSQVGDPGELMYGSILCPEVWEVGELMV